MVKIKWTKMASSDINAIHTYISRDSKIYAARLVKSLISTTVKLEDMPLLGHNWGHFESGIIGDFEYDEDYRLHIMPIGEDDEKWKEIVGDDLFKRSLEKNFMVKKSLYECYIRKYIKRQIVEDLQRMRFL